MARFYMMQAVVVIPVQEPQALFKAEQHRLRDQYHTHHSNVRDQAKPGHPFLANSS